MKPAQQNDLIHRTIPSPIGPLTLLASSEGLEELIFEKGRIAHPERLARAREAKDAPLLCAVAQQLDEYFQGVRRDFSVRLAPLGTPFQRAVWALLGTLPYGTTTSYGALAERLGDGKKARAVGAANGRNPIGIIIPCHRLLAYNGALTGFGGGLPIKAALLQLESGGLMTRPQAPAKE